MEVLTFTPKDYFGSNMYLVRTESESAVIDPSVSAADFRDFFSDNRLSLKYIILTVCKKNAIHFAKVI